MCYAGLMAQSVCVIVSAVDRERLEAIVADRNQRQEHVEPARIVLASADRGRHSGLGRDNAYLAEHNASPKPFVWTKSADAILWSNSPAIEPGSR
jgi:hypothetical protein